MLLVLTTTQDATADYLCQRLKTVGVQFRRFDTDRYIRQTTFAYRNSQPTLYTFAGETFRPADFQNVWFRRPEALEVPAPDDPAETEHVRAEWSSAIEGFLAHIAEDRWVNHPGNNVRASYKVEQLTRAAHFGFNVPRSLVTQSANALREFWAECQGQVLVKPLAFGFIQRSEPAADTLIYANQIAEADLDIADTTLSTCPTLFQQIVPKTIDVRITVIDENIYPIGLSAHDNGTARLDIRTQQHGRCCLFALHFLQFWWIVSVTYCKVSRLGLRHSTWL